MILSNLQKVNRLGIFFFYDKDGIVDDYVTYLLNGIKPFLSELLVVCNGKLAPDSRVKLEGVTKQIFVRENKGFDVWAYKEGMEYYGWDRLKTYDELIMFNFTIFGPLYPLKEMFEHMDKRDLDFWGITAYNGADYDPFGKIKYGYLPLHIQSHFIAVRSRMIQSYEFMRYWDNMVPITSYEEAISLHEAIFTKEFEDKGFTWETYVDTSDLVKHSHAPIIMTPLELVKNRKCPIVKRRSFFHHYSDYLNYTTGEQSIDVFEFIKKHLDYDVGLIWANILRTNNQAEIKNSMHLNYILPTEISPAIPSSRKIALIIHIYFEDLINYCFNYAQSILPGSDVFITTDTELKKKLILEKFKALDCAKLEVIIIQNRGRDVSALLVGCKDFISHYDYVCFVHDKKTTQVEPNSVGESFSYKCFENSLHNRHFVTNVIDTFEKNPFLGMLVPPPPNHAHFYSTVGCEWGDNYSGVIQLAKKLKLNINIDHTQEPIAPLGTMFWFRPKALQTLFEFEWKYEDFPKEPNTTDGSILHHIERIYPYVVQNEGYYTGWVLADSFARIELTNLNFMLRELNVAYFSKCGPTIHYSMLVNFKHNMEFKRSFMRSVKHKLKKYLPASTFKRIKKTFYFLRLNKIVKF